MVGSDFFCLYKEDKYTYFNIGQTLFCGMFGGEQISENPFNRGIYCAFRSSPFLRFIFFPAKNKFAAGEILKLKKIHF